MFCFFFYFLVGCAYAPWSFWSTCSQSCGAGIQTRQRQKINEVACDAGPQTERKTCEIQPCEGKIQP